MKFKVGDKVRYDRDFLIDTITTRDYYRNSGLRGFKIVQIEGEEVRSEDGFWFHESHLELIHEESEIKHGDIIEVSDDGEHWVKRMFIAKTDNGDFITTDCIDKNHFINGWSYKIESYKYARKSIPQLTRKEIAEKFGVNEDFILIDDTNENNIPKRNTRSLPSLRW